MADAIGNDSLVVFRDDGPVARIDCVTPGWGARANYSDGSAYFVRAEDLARARLATEADIARSAAEDDAHRRFVDAAMRAGERMLSGLDAGEASADRDY